MCSCIFQDTLPGRLRQSPVNTAANLDQKASRTLLALGYNLHCQRQLFFFLRLFNDIDQLQLRLYTACNANNTWMPVISRYILVVILQPVRAETYLSSISQGRQVLC